MDTDEQEGVGRDLEVLWSFLVWDVWRDALFLAGSSAKKEVQQVSSWPLCVSRLSHQHQTPESLQVDRMIETWLKTTFGGSSRASAGGWEVPPGYGLSGRVLAVRQRVCRW